jgi:hypothetical protein
MSAAVPFLFSAKVNGITNETQIKELGVGDPDGSSSRPASFHSLFGQASEFAEIWEKAACAQMRGAGVACLGE